MESASTVGSAPMETSAPVPRSPANNATSSGVASATAARTARVTGNGAGVVRNRCVNQRGAATSERVAFTFPIMADTRTNAKLRRMAERRFSFEINRTSSAPPEVLFALETDGPSWARWARPLVWQASWTRTGDPSPAGAGAVRRVGLWPLLMQERTLEYEPSRRHVYTLAGSHPPVRDYRAEVLFTPNESGG